MRLNFYELASNTRVATEVLRRTAALYGFEDRGHRAEKRRIVRIEHSRLIIGDLKQYLEARNRQVSAKSKLGEAIRYLLMRWEGLTLFIDTGRVDLDNNTVKRSIRPLALSRKNALFADLSKAAITGQLSLRSSSAASSTASTHTSG